MKIGPLQPDARADRGEKFIHLFIMKKKTYLSTNTNLQVTITI